jgi:hypothetical protein
MATDPLNRLCKWRMVLAGWIGGTRTLHEDGTKGLRDLMDKFLMARCEGSAFAALAIKKGLFSAEEFRVQLDKEADYLNTVYERLFPGFKTTNEGIVIYDFDLANDTMKRLGFPP